MPGSAARRYRGGVHQRAALEAESWPGAAVVGWDATASIGALALAMPLMLVSIIAYLGFAGKARAWHEGRSLVDQGEGRLAKDSRE